MNHRTWIALAVLVGALAPSTIATAQEGGLDAILARVSSAQTVPEGLDAFGYYNRAVMLEKKGARDEAIYCFHQASELLAPGHPLRRYALQKLRRLLDEIPPQSGAASREDPGDDDEAEEQVEEEDEEYRPAKGSPKPRATRVDDEVEEDEGENYEDGDEDGETDEEYRGAKAKPRPRITHTAEMDDEDGDEDGEEDADEGADEDGDKGDSEDGEENNPDDEGEAAAREEGEGIGVSFIAARGESYRVRSSASGESCRAPCTLASAEGTDYVTVTGDRDFGRSIGVGPRGATYEIRGRSAPLIILGSVTAGVGAVAVIVGAATYEKDTYIHTNSVTQEVEWERHSRTLNYVAFGVGGTAVIAGTVLAIIGGVRGNLVEVDDQAAEDADVGIAPLPGGGLVQVGAHF